MTDPLKNEPFSSATRSGGLLREIAAEMRRVSIYYTNLVKCLPLRHDKIRYPNRGEMELCFRNYRAELSALMPRKVVLFGQQVSSFVADKLELTFPASERDFEFPVARVGNVEYLSAYHPSYVLVYKRRKLDLYKSRIAEFIGR